MTNTAKKIVVAGDVTIDWVQWATDADADPQGVEKTPNWRLYPGARSQPLAGGACLLSAMISKATSTMPGSTNVISHPMRAIHNTRPDRIIHSISILDVYAKSSKDQEKDCKDAVKVFRVKRYLGFNGPIQGSVKPIPIDVDVANANLLVFDDAGNSFRDADKIWQDALTKNPQAVTILKMSRPLGRGDLWEALVIKDKSRKKKLVVVVNADHLRESGMKISRRLSWERAALDCEWQLRNHTIGKSLTDAAHLIVRFGLEGVIHVTHDHDNLQMRFYYDPKRIEEGYTDEKIGSMQGFSSAFTAALAAHIVQTPGDIAAGIKRGMWSARRLFEEGFGIEKGIPKYPLDSIFTLKEAFDIAEVDLPSSVDKTTEQVSTWTIFKDTSQGKTEAMAYEMVSGIVNPQISGLWKKIPVAEYEKLRVIDRSEIESYQSIRNLIQEYLALTDTKRPLSIAVFGPPGSGKSFGITELAKSIDSKQVERIEFNVSQFSSQSDLAGVFHQIRDIALKGKVPLVFFDEFDAALNGELGWLKYFLAPMQDGTFRDRESSHPIGKAIFVFAGGTRFTFESFYPEEDPTFPNASIDPSSALARFRIAKGPDFASRLRGYINIIGPNRSSVADSFYMLRRAMQLRFALKELAPQLWPNKNAPCRIDHGVLRALIKCPNYKHGVRSMLAILDMSMLAGRRVFDQSALPSREQLKMHVDADFFIRLVEHDVLFGEALEPLAKQIHKNYLASLSEAERNARPLRPSHCPWEELTEEYRESNREQADHYGTKLYAIGCGIEPLVGKRTPITFSAAEIETMAKLEHKRWMAEKLTLGWTYGETRVDAQKLHPCLLDWDDPRLPDDEKKKDRNAAENIPTVLIDSGFAAYRLE